MSLVAGGSFRIIGVSEQVWRYSVSGYQLLYKWLKAREGSALHGAGGIVVVRQALDVVWRIEELIALGDEADIVLDDILPLTLSRDELNLPAPLAGLTEVEALNDDATD